MGAGKWPLILKLEHKISKFDRAGFLIFVLVFVSRDSELDQNLSGHFQKMFSSDLNEIWYVGRGRWVMHDGMPYGRNQGQGQSREVDRQSPTGLIFFHDNCGERRPLSEFFPCKSERIYEAGIKTSSSSSLLSVCVQQLYN